MAGRSKCVNQEAPKYVPRVKRIAGGLGECQAAEISAKAMSASKFWTSDDRAPRGHRERHAKKEW